MTRAPAGARKYWRRLSVAGSALGVALAIGAAIVMSRSDEIRSATGRGAPATSAESSGGTVTEGNAAIAQLDAAELRRRLEAEGFSVRAEVMEQPTRPGERFTMFRIEGPGGFGTVQLFELGSAGEARSALVRTKETMGLDAMALSGGSKIVVVKVHANKPESMRLLAKLSR